MVKVIKIGKSRNYPNLKTLNKELTEDQRFTLAIVYNNLLYLEKRGQQKQFFDRIVKISQISSCLKKNMIL